VLNRIHVELNLTFQLSRVEDMDPILVRVTIMPNYCTPKEGGMITIVLREELRSNAYKRHISCLGAIQLYGNIHRKINRLLVTGNRFNLPTSEGTANSAPGRMKQNNMLTRNQDCAKRHWRFRPAWFDSSPLQERDCCSRKSSDCHQQ